MTVDTGKTSLAVAAAGALGHPHMRVPLGGGDAQRLLRGRKGDAAGAVVRGLHRTGVRNPVVILEAVDRVDKPAADALLDVLNPAHRPAFRDEYLRVPIDLSAVVWVATATDASAIPEEVRERPGGDRGAGVRRGGEAGHRAKPSADTPLGPYTASTRTARSSRCCFSAAAASNWPRPYPHGFDHIAPAGRSCSSHSMDRGSLKGDVQYSCATPASLRLAVLPPVVYSEDPPQAGRRRTRVPVPCRP